MWEHLLDKPRLEDFGNHQAATEEDELLCKIQLFDAKWEIDELKDEVALWRSRAEMAELSEDRLTEALAKLIIENSALKEAKITELERTCKFQADHDRVGYPSSPPSSGFTSSSPSSRFPSSPPSSGFTSSSPSSGFPSSSPSPGFPAPPPSSWFPAPPPSHGYTTPPPSHGYTTPPPSHGYTTPPPSYEFSAPPPTKASPAAPGGMFVSYYEAQASSCDLLLTLDSILHETTLPPPWRDETMTSPIPAVMITFHQTAAPSAE